MLKNESKNERRFPWSRLFVSVLVSLGVRCSPQGSHGVPYHLSRTRYIAIYSSLVDRKIKIINIVFITFLNMRLAVPEDKDKAGSVPVSRGSSESREFVSGGKTRVRASGTRAFSTRVMKFKVCARLLWQKPKPFMSCCV